jgi:hypothetical protein
VEHVSDLQSNVRLQSTKNFLLIGWNWQSIKWTKTCLCLCQSPRVMTRKLKREAQVWCEMRWWASVLGCCRSWLSYWQNFSINKRTEVKKWGMCCHWQVLVYRAIYLVVQDQTHLYKATGVDLPFLFLFHSSVMGATWTSLQVSP